MACLKATTRIRSPPRTTPRAHPHSCLAQPAAARRCAPTSGRTDCLARVGLPGYVRTLDLVECTWHPRKADSATTPHQARRPGGHGLHPARQHPVMARPQQRLHRPDRPHPSTHRRRRPRLSISVVVVRSLPVRRPTRCWFTRCWTSIFRDSSRTSGSARVRRSAAWGQGYGQSISAVQDGVRGGRGWSSGRLRRLRLALAPVSGYQQ